MRASISANSTATTTALSRVAAWRMFCRSSMCFVLGMNGLRHSAPDGCSRVGSPGELRGQLLVVRRLDCPRVWSMSRKLELVLTPRELQVARLGMEGLTDREVAEKLFITRRTAEWHLKQIFNKLGFSSRSQVAAWVAHDQ